MSVWFWFVDGCECKAAQSNVKWSFADFESDYKVIMCGHVRNHLAPCITLLPPVMESGRMGPERNVAFQNPPVGFHDWRAPVVWRNLEPDNTRGCFLFVSVSKPRKVSEQDTPQFMIARFCLFGPYELRRPRGVLASFRGPAGCGWMAASLC